MTDSTESNVHSLVTREEALSTLDDLVRSSARRMLQAEVPFFAYLMFLGL